MAPACAGRWPHSPPWRRRQRHARHGHAGDESAGCPPPKPKPGEAGAPPAHHPRPAPARVPKVSPTLEARPQAMPGMPMPAASDIMRCPVRQCQEGGHAATARFPVRQPLRLVQHRWPGWRWRVTRRWRGCRAWPAGHRAVSSRCQSFPDPGLDGIVTGRLPLPAGADGSGTSAPAGVGRSDARSPPDDRRLDADAPRLRRLGCLYQPVRSARRRDRVRHVDGHGRGAARSARRRRDADGAHHAPASTR